MRKKIVLLLFLLQNEQRDTLVTIDHDCSKAAAEIEIEYDMDNLKKTSFLFLPY